MLRRHWTLILLVLAPLVALWRPVFLGETIGPVDQIAHMAPFHGPTPEQPWDVLQADGVLQFLPWRDLVFRSWSRGQIPGWNPYELAGTPLLANSQSGALYPPHILAGFAYGLGTNHLITLLAWLHLALAGLGASALCRRLGGSPIGGLIASLSFSMSAFLLSWTALPSVTETVAWIPWAMVAATRALDGPDRRERTFGVLGLAASVAMMTLAGHLQFVAYGAMAVAVFAGGRAIAHLPKNSRKANAIGLACVFAGLVAGFALAAPQLLPVLEFSKSSHRRNVPTEDGYQAYSQNAIHLWELGGAVYPKLNGDPTANIDLEGQSVSSYWPQYVRVGANFAESALALGPLVVCLLMCARRKAPYWRELSPLVFGGFLALLLALGTAANRLLYFPLPGWSSTGSPGRASVIVVLAGCVAAGVVASQPVEPSERRRKLYAPIAGFLALTVVSVYFVMFGLTGLRAAVFDADTLASMMRAATRTGAIEAVAAGIITAIAVGLWIRSGRQQTAYLFAPILVAPLLVLPPLIRSERDDFRLKSHSADDHGGHGRIAVINDRWSLFGIPSAFLPSNLSALNQNYELGGYDSLLDKDTKALIDDIDGANSTPPENGNMLFIKSKADPAKLASAGVTEVWSDRELPQFGPATQTEGWPIFVHKISGPGRLSNDAGDAKCIQDEPNQIVIQASGPGHLTFRDRNLPGWTATIDGKPTEISPGIWRVIALEPGSHTVTFTFSPPGLKTGAAIALVALLALLAPSVLFLKRSKAS